MDPDSNLSEQLAIAERIIAGEDGDTVLDDCAIRLAELVQALDTWISNGGFVPARWLHDNLRSP